MRELPHGISLTQRHLSLTKIGVSTGMSGRYATKTPFFVAMYLGTFHFCIYFEYSSVK
jgi:hypothetical protein